MPQVIAATVMSGTHEFVPALIFRKVNLKKSIYKFPWLSWERTVVVIF
jgi:hypothetical protein